MRKEIPILFSTPMVQAILNGRKIMTRRIVKPRKAEDFALMVNMNAGINVDKCIEELTRCECPFGKAGDVLWVRETWMFNDDTNEPYAFKADYNEDAQRHLRGSWKPSIFLPKSVCRIWLEVVNVSIERLLSVSEADAQMEGVELYKSGKYYLNYVDQKHGLTQFIYNCRTAKESFISLWDLINGKENRLQDPWVWVIKFNILSTTGKPESLS